MPAGKCWHLKKMVCNFTAGFVVWHYLAAGWYGQSTPLSSPYLLIKGHDCDKLNLLLEAQCPLRCGWHSQAPLPPLKDDSHDRDLVQGPAPTQRPPPVRERSSTKPGSSRPAVSQGCKFL
jgi:hypothetical protein